MSFHTDSVPISFVSFHVTHCKPNTGIKWFKSCWLEVPTTYTLYSKCLSPLISVNKLVRCDFFLSFCYLIKKLQYLPTYRKRSDGSPCRWAWSGGWRGTASALNSSGIASPKVRGILNIENTVIMSSAMDPDPYSLHKPPSRYPRLGYLGKKKLGVKFHIKLCTHSLRLREIYLCKPVLWSCGSGSGSDPGGQKRHRKIEKSA